MIERYAWEVNDWFAARFRRKDGQRSSRSSHDNGWRLFGFALGAVFSLIGAVIIVFFLRSLKEQHGRVLRWALVGAATQAIVVALLT
jgi:hypothetical protein